VLLLCPQVWSTGSPTCQCCIPICLPASRSLWEPPPPVAPSALAPRTRALTLFGNRLDQVGHTATLSAAADRQQDDAAVCGHADSKVVVATCGIMWPTAFTRMRDCQGPGKWCDAPSLIPRLPAYSLTLTLCAGAALPCLREQVDEQPKSAAKLAVHLLKQPQSSSAAVSRAASSSMSSADAGLDRMLSLGLGAVGASSRVAVQGLLHSRFEQPQDALVAAGDVVPDGSSSGSLAPGICEGAAAGEGVAMSAAVAASADALDSFSAAAGAVLPPQQHWGLERGSGSFL